MGPLKEKLKKCLDYDSQSHSVYILCPLRILELEDT